MSNNEHEPVCGYIEERLKIAKVLHKQHILSVQPVKDTDHVSSQSEQVVSKADLDKFHQLFRFKISPTLDEDKRYQILELLYKYKSVFAHDVSYIKAGRGPPLTLDVHTNRKTFQCDIDKKEVTRQVNQMLHADVIELSDTPYYNSPICLVSNKSGKKRLVVDLHAKNSIITPRLVQLPKINEMLDTITAQKPCFLSTFDTTLAFWQTIIAEESRDDHLHCPRWKTLEVQMHPVWPLVQSGSLNFDPVQFVW